MTLSPRREALGVKVSVDALELERILELTLPAVTRTLFTFQAIVIGSLLASVKLALKLITVLILIFGEVLDGSVLDKTGGAFFIILKVLVSFESASETLTVRV
jgi:hypothetical protein